ncbi:MAG TPA: glycosyltransferase family 4 protein [Thermoleophilaceae bacterium]|nr:glycosyltransferase family 4 protein [Thermoleophilaceae bacterium]
MRRSRAKSTDPILSRDRVVPRPVRVLVVAPSPRTIGGQSNQAAILLERLAAEPSVEPSFLASDPRLPGPLRALQRVRYLRTIANSLVYVAGLLRRVPPADVVHVFSSSNTSFVITATPAILVARLLRKGALLHYHSGEAHTHLREWRTAVPTLRLVGAIVSPSVYVASAFERHGLPVRVIPNVLEADRFEFRERAPLRPLVLSNRALLPYCHVEDVLRAFALVRARARGARLIVAADGPERASLERLAGELGRDGIEFTGWIAPESIGSLYASADVLLNTSGERDNVPMSILEAFAAGLPVVSTAVAGIPELVRDGETGLLTPPGDHRAIASAVLRLLHDPELASRLAHAARESLVRHRWEAVRGPWLALYEEQKPG